jgi:hypothetical protein
MIYLFTLFPPSKYSQVSHDNLETYAEWWLLSSKSVLSRIVGAQIFVIYFVLKLYFPLFFYIVVPLLNLFPHSSNHIPKIDVTSIGPHINILRSRKVNDMDHVLHHGFNRYRYVSSSFRRRHDLLPSNITDYTSFIEKQPNTSDIEKIILSNSDESTAFPPFSANISINIPLPQAQQVKGRKKHGTTKKSPPSQSPPALPHSPSYRPFLSSLRSSFSFLSRLPSPLSGRGTRRSTNYQHIPRSAVTLPGTHPIPTHTCGKGKSRGNETLHSEMESQTKKTFSKKLEKNKDRKVKHNN